MIPLWSWLLTAMACMLCIPAFDFWHFKAVSEIQMVCSHAETPNLIFELGSCVPNPPRPMTVTITEPLYGKLLFDTEDAKWQAY